MKNIILILVVCVALSFAGCTYRAIPTVSRDGDFKSPTMHKAEDTAPAEVPSARAPKDDKAAQAAKSKAEKPVVVAEEGDEGAEDGDEPQQTVGEVDALAPIVVATTSREREHLSFSSYNPFVGGDSFVVNLDSLAEGFCYPIEGHLLSPYGPRGRGWHSGADLKGQQGDPIFAAFDGVVRLSRYYGGYGNVIVIRHNNGLETAYSHNSENLVSVGDQVQAGDKIALCGRTGRATGTHCHFEVRIIGQALNPALLLDYEKRSIQKGALYVSRSGSNKVTASRKSASGDFDNVSRPSVPKDSYVASNEAPSATTSVSSSPTTSQSNGVVSSTSSSSVQYHKIVSGDTLGGLARKYGTTVKALCSMNNITERTLLQLGKRLRVK